MIDEAVLERLLTDAGERYEPPAGAAERILTAAGRIEATRRPSVGSRLAALRRRPPGRGPRQARPREAARLAPVAAVVVLALGGIVALAVALGSGGDGSTSGSSAGRAAESLASAPQDRAAAGSGTLAAPAVPPSGSGDTARSVPSVSPRVVQTGSVTVQVGRDRLQASLDRLTALANGLGGFVAQSSSDTTDPGSSGQITLRVPVASFAKLQDGVRKVGTVLSTSTSSRDVTGQYVDLAARIRALQDERSTYLTLLSKATTIGDTLSIQQQVTAVQTQIEQLQGQQQVLADSSDLATLTVSVSEVGAPVTTPAGPKHGFGAAVSRSWDRFTGGLEAIVGVIGPLALVALVAAVLFVAFRLGRRYVRRRLV